MDLYAGDYLCCPFKIQVYDPVENIFGGDVPMSMSHKLIIYLKI